MAPTPPWSFADFRRAFFYHPIYIVRVAMETVNRQLVKNIKSDDQETGIAYQEAENINS